MTKLETNKLFRLLEQIERNTREPKTLPIVSFSSDAESVTRSLAAIKIVKKGKNK